MTTTAATTPPVTLTAEQQRQWAEDGYVVVRNLIEPALMHALKLELDNLMNGLYESWDVGHFQFADPKKIQAPNGKMVPGGVQGPSGRGAPFTPICDHPRLQSAMAQLLGGPVRRYTDQCVLKSRYLTNEQGGQTYFHQDSYYWHIRPQAGANVWIPCEPVGKDAIALAMMPGSHKGWTLVDHEQYYDDPAYCSPRTLEPFKRHRIPRETIDFSKEALVPLNTGDGVFFTNFTWHRAEPNRTGRHLAGYAIAYQLDRDDVKMK